MGNWEIGTPIQVGTPVLVRKGTREGVSDLSDPVAHAFFNNMTSNQLLMDTLLEAVASRKSLLWNLTLRAPHPRNGCNEETDCTECASA